MVGSNLKYINWIFTLAFTSIFLLTTPLFCQASGFNLTTIGNSSTQGRVIHQWWYSGNQPILRGEAEPNSPINIDIDGQIVQINADSSGNWDFATSALAPGDHLLNLTNNNSTISFTLTIGTESINWNEAGKNPPDTLPTVGNFTSTLAIITFGTLLLAFSLLFSQPQKS